MTFLIDPPLLAAAGYAIGRSSACQATQRRAAYAVAAGFLVPSISFYVNAPVLERAWRCCGYPTGRAMIINSWVFRFRTDPPSVPTDMAAGAMFAAYPLWLAWGVSRGRRRRRGVLR
jgi:hypothetical protein